MEQKLVYLGGPNPIVEKVFPCNNKYNDDIREFIKSIIEFRKTYRIFIKNGIKWTSPEKDIL